MGTIVAETLIDKVQTQLHDITGIRFGSAELLGWLNDGVSEIANLKPDACALAAAVKSSAGSRQELPVTGFQLIDVIRNMGTDGTTAGQAVTRQDRALFDSAKPGWSSETPTATAKHWLFDLRDPVGFYVYPPADGTGYLEIIYASVPSAIEEDAAIPINDIYGPVLIDYILSRAYAKDTDAAANGERSSGHYQRFITALQGREAQEQADNPTAQTR